MRKLTLILFAASVLSCTAAHAQDDSPSLGDVARQTRRQKQERDAQVAKEAQTSTAATNGTQNADPANAQPSKAPKRIITNEEIPEHVGPASTVTPSPRNVSDPPKSGDSMASAQVKAQILQIKNNIASLQSQIADLEQSVHYTGNNCVYGCAQWNENQQKKQEQVETMKQQLAQQQEGLERLQEMARKQGYGSSVYDPEQ